MDEHLFASVRATGLAGFSNVANSPELMKKSRRDYSTAIQLVNAALRSPADVSKDSTLLAVMILSIFEAISGFNQRSLKAWAEHIHGAAALVNVRGCEQLRSREGFRLFNQVTSGLLMSCIHHDAGEYSRITNRRLQIYQYLMSRFTGGAYKHEGN